MPDPQGWYRQADDEGLVRHVDWPEGLPLLARADAVVLSIEDLRGDEQKVEELAKICKLLVVTESRDGARVFSEGRVRYFSAPAVELVEDTGAVTFLRLVSFTACKQPKILGKQPVLRFSFHPAL